MFNCKTSAKSHKFFFFYTLSKLCILAIKGKDNEYGDNLFFTDKTSIKDLTGRTETDEGRTSIEVDREEDVTFTCIAMTDPREAVRYVWKKNGKVIKDFSDSHVLHVQEADATHSGNYTCVANNGIDEDQRTIELRVKGMGFQTE